MKYVLIAGVTLLALGLVMLRVSNKDKTYWKLALVAGVLVTWGSLFTFIPTSGCQHTTNGPYCGYCGEYIAALCSECGAEGTTTYCTECGNVLRTDNLKELSDG